MKSKIMKICFNPKAGLLLLLSMAMVAIFAIAIPSATLAAASDDDVSTKCKGVLDKDLPKCGPVDPNSIRLDVSKCSSQITLNGNGEMVGPCDFIVNFKGLKDAEGYNIHVTMYNEKGEEVHKTASGVREGSTPDPWVTRNSDGTISYRFDGNRLFRETYGDNYSLDKLGTTDNIYDLKTSAGNPYLSLGAKSFSCGKQTFVIKVTPICPCPKGGDLACGKPKRCDTFVDNAKNTDGSYRKFIINSDGTFREVKKTDSDYSKGTDLPSDPEYRQMYIAEKLKDPTLTFAKFAANLEGDTEWCINGTKVYGPKNGDVCKGEACLWKCKSIDGKKIIDCTLPNTVACDGPNGSILTPPEDFWPNLTPEQAREADWYKDNLDWKQNPYMKGWYNLCLVNGKPTNRCAGAVSTVSGASTWTCGSAPNQVKCKSCIKAKCGSAALDKNGKQARYSKNELEALLKSNPKAFCNPGDLVNFWTTYTGLGKHERSWSCVGDKSCGENIANCVITEKYCGDDIKDPGEECEKDSDCPGLNGKCLDNCKCCPDPTCGEPTQKDMRPVYRKDSDGVWKMFSLPTPQCKNGVVKDQSKENNQYYTWMDYIDAAGKKIGYRLMPIMNEDETKWDRPYQASWTCKSECSGKEVTCGVTQLRCGDGVLDPGEDCEKGIPCANGQECSPTERSKCKCEECQTDADCAPEKISCKDAYTKKVEIEKCVEVRKGGPKVCKKEIYDSPCSKDESYCGPDNKTLIKSKERCELVGNGAKCVRNEISTKCSDGDACNGFEKCKDITPFGDLLRKADCSGVSDPPGCPDVSNEGCKLTPDKIDFTWDILSTHYYCVDNPDNDSEDYLVGWTCEKEETVASHKCDKKCGAKCLPQLNDGQNGRNSDCVAPMCENPDPKVSRKSLASDPYGTCLAGCDCSFSNLKYICQRNQCGAQCSTGDPNCEPDCTLTPCGDGKVEFPETCDPPGSPWKQSATKCDGKMKLTRSPMGATCNDLCQIVESKWTNEGCSKTCDLSVADACVGKQDGDSIPGGKYCLGCKVVDCLTNADCTGVHYLCNANTLYSAKEKCENNKCVTDQDQSKFGVKKCGTVYDCTKTSVGGIEYDATSVTSEICSVQNPYGDGTYKQGSCEPGTPVIKACNQNSYECISGKKFTEYGSRCETDKVTKAECIQDIPVYSTDCGNKEKSTCNFAKTAVVNSSYVCSINVSDWGNPLDSDYIKGCKKTESEDPCAGDFDKCDGDNILYMTEKCVQSFSGASCQEEENSRNDCNVLDGKSCSRDYRSILNYDYTCDPLSVQCKATTTTAENCAPKDKAAINVCGDESPLTGLPAYNPYKKYNSKAFTSQCNDAGSDPVCTTCERGASGSACEWTSKCDATPITGCSNDMSCDGLEPGDSCISGGKNGVCDDTCTCAVLECGVDDGGVFTDQSQLTKKCASGSFVVDFNFDDVTGSWTWKCYKGGLGGPFVSCSATQLSCGVLDGESYNPIKIAGAYLPEKTSTTGYSTVLDLDSYCQNGTAVIGWVYNNNQSLNNGWEWKWKCRYDVGGTVVETGECHAKALDCGYADAQYFLDNDGRLSYAEGKGAHKYNSMPATLCANGFPVHTSVKNEYGSLSWECMTIDGSIKKTCYARSQCPLEDIETVYYVNKNQTIKQCWTAEEEVYSGSTQIEWPNVMFCGKDDASNNCGRGSDIDYYGMNYYGWGERLGSVEIGSFSDGYAKDVQGDHPFNRIIRDDHPGICPTGYKVPTESDWTTLSDVAKYNDDLRRKSGFYAKSGGYWTQTPGEEDSGGVRRNSPIYFDRDANNDYGKFTSAGYIYDQGGKTTYNPNAAGSKHQLRCIKTGPLQLFTPIKCVGRGCYNPWIIRM